jgi:hypothetical protein
MTIYAYLAIVVLVVGAIGWFIRYVDKSGTAKGVQKAEVESEKKMADTVTRLSNSSDDGFSVSHPHTEWGATVGT